uniref:Succinate dehydrogenase [ubiquinone] iron-sulfur subunit, mitochondrial n=1 Tax=Diabrotica virgifera virgifera TaxID=50390 RepID=A0A6P7HIQ6_DIAVI
MLILKTIFKKCLVQCTFLPILHSRLLTTKANTETKKPPAKEAPAKKQPLLKTFKIYRYDPEKEGCKPMMKPYTIDLNDCRPTVLDALNKIKTEQDPSLTFRKSCREGICGSCGMNMDGVNGLACLKKINPRGVTKVYPLPHMYVIKDLVVDFKKFMQQHNRIKPYLIRNPPEEKNMQFSQSVKDRADMRLLPGKAIAKLRLLVANVSSKKKPDMDGTAMSDPVKACDQKKENAACKTA